MDKNTAKENIIELKNISRTFDDGFCVVDDFNLTIQRVSLSRFWDHRAAERQRHCV